MSEMASNDTLEFDYSTQNERENEDNTLLYRLRMLYIVAYLIICTLGVILNTYVITAGCYMYHKLQKSALSVWVLALAVTHLVSSTFLVMQFQYAWHYFNWQYGVALCKISSYIIYASMFSTAAMLSLWTISGSSCIKGLCAKFGVIILVLSSWTSGTVLSIPSLFSRELRYTEIGKECIDDYDLDKEKTTDYGRKYLTIVVLSRVLLGVFGPMFVMIICPFLARRQGHNEDVTCKRIICAIKLAHFMCWMPLLLMALYQVTVGNVDFLKIGLPAATVLAAAHSCINPVIYLSVGGTSMHWMAGYTRQFADENIALN